MWNMRESSMSFLKSVCIVRSAVRLSSARGNFLMSNGSMGTFGAGTGASYELNKCTILAISISKQDEDNVLVLVQL